MAGECPTPWKMGWTTRRECLQNGCQNSRRVSKKLGAKEKGQLRPYRCPGCGLWHTTTMTKADLRRVKKHQKTHSRPVGV